MKYNLEAAATSESANPLTPATVMTPSHWNLKISDKFKISAYGENSHSVLATIPCNKLISITMVSWMHRKIETNCWFSHQPQTRNNHYFVDKYSHDEQNYHKTKYDSTQILLTKICLLLCLVLRFRFTFWSFRRLQTCEKQNGIYFFSNLVQGSQTLFVVLLNALITYSLRLQCDWSQRQVSEPNFVWQNNIQRAKWNVFRTRCVLFGQ